MANKIILGLAILLAIVMAFAPDMDSGGLIALGLVVLGLAYGAMAVDAEDAVAFLVLAVAVSGAGGSDVLNGIPAIGMHLDAIVDSLAKVLAAGVVTVLAVQCVNRLKG